MSEEGLVVLKPFIETARESAIALLEHVLEEAKQGEVVAISMAIVRPDNSTSHCFSKSDRISLLIGATTAMQFSLCEQAAGG